MSTLPPIRTLCGRYSAYCGICWEPVYSLWVDSTPPEYEACPFGPYTAQTCPQSLVAAKRAKLSAELERRGMTLAEYMTEVAREAKADTAHRDRSITSSGRP